MKKINLLLLSTLLVNTFTYNNIFEDVRAKDKEAIKQRIENGEDCAIKDERGNNALHVAVQKSDIEIIDVLTTAPYYPNWSDWLYSWIYWPTLPNIDEQNDDGNSPLLCATQNGQLTIAEKLVQKGARMDIVNNEELPAAFVAVLKDDPRFIRLFVAHKLNLAQHTYKGDTVFHIAIKERKPYTINYCAQETSLHTITNKDYKTPIFLAIDTEDDVLDIFTKEQLNAPSSSDIKKPIHYATHHNKYNVINCLLNKGISINEPDMHGNPPLFYANNTKTLNFLLERNADLHKRNNKGEDVLAVATHNNNLSLIETLTQQPTIDINARDNKGQTPLICAAIEQRYDAMTKFIKNEKVNIRMTDNARETVLHKIARIGDRRAANIVLDTNREKDLLLTDLNKNGESPLFVAIQNGHTSFAEFLIEQGSRIDTINTEGNTIIHELVKKNNNELLTRLRTKLNYNLINHKNKQGNSPIYLATKNDNVEIIKTLILYKADIYRIDNEGNNIAHIAAKHGSFKTLKYLQSNHALFTSTNNRGKTPFVYGALEGEFETIKFLLNEEHFKNGEVVTAINALKDTYLWNNQRHIYDFLVQQHSNRVKECQDIVTIAQNTLSLIIENNNLCTDLRKKQHNVIYNPVEFYSYYSADQLYAMDASERTRIKNKYLECHNKERIVRDNLRQKLDTINTEEQKEKARVDALKDELIKAKAAAEQNKIEENKKEEINNTPTEDNAQQISCCICYEEDLSLLKKIPCKNAHSDRICGSCLQAPSVKTCPICRGPLTK